MRDAAQTILDGVDTLMDEDFSELKLKCLIMIKSKNAVVNYHAVKYNNIILVNAHN